jgi:hypothetical protein
MRMAQMEHASIAAFARFSLGPNVLSIDGALTTPTLESVVETTLIEGCIGELVAAAEARESAGPATDPVVGRALSEIADDESRHATLASRFLGWAIELGGAPLLERACRVASLELRRARAAAASVSLEASLEDTSALGILSEALRARLRVEVIANVVVPALDAMHASRMVA